MKRALALILVLVEIVSMVLLACSIASRFQREDESYATNVSSDRRIITDKTVYVEGESIMVTAWSPNIEDMVIICPKNNGPQRIRWYYIGSWPGTQETNMFGPGSGQSNDIRRAFLSGSVGASDLQDIPPGEYTVYMTDGSTDNIPVYCYTTITVVAAQE